MPAPVPRPFPSGLRPVTLDEGERIVRVHRTSNGPIWFGPAPGVLPANRFDAPAGEYRTLYAAHRLTGGFVETILRKNRRILTRAFVEQFQWTVLRVERPLTLAKLYDEGLAWHGTTNDICAGDDYAEPRALARDLYLSFPDLDGIAYRARHNNGEICFALFDRVAPGDLVPVDTHLFAHERRWTRKLVADHGGVWDRSPPLIDPSSAP